MAQHEIAQGRSLQLVNCPWYAGYTNALWAVSPKLGTQALPIPPIQYGPLLDRSIFILLAQNTRSKRGIFSDPLGIEIRK